jgi:photosystem II stability/assembly factor-like uncharacterized protein
MSRKNRSKTRRVFRQERSRRPWLIWAVGVLVIVGVVVLWYMSQGARTSVGATASSEIKPVGSIKAADYHSLAFSPTDPTTVFFGHHNGIMQSKDGGRSWQPAIERANFDAMILGASAGTLWMAGHNVFYKTTDRGGSWSEVPPANLPGLDLHAFAVSPKDPNILYAFAVGYGLFRSSDEGRSWEPLGAGAPSQPFALAVGGDPEVLFVGTEQGIVRSEDGGRTFSPPRAVGGQPVMALAVTPQGDQLFAGTPKGLYRSSDGGRNWARTSYDGAVAAVAVAPTTPPQIVLVDRQGKVFATS